MDRVRIFVSSRTHELHNERVMIKMAFDKEQYDVFVFEDDAGARTEPATEVYVEKVLECDIYLGLFKEEYSQPTEKEYNLAVANHKGIVIYRCDYNVKKRAPLLDSLFNRFKDKHTIRGYDNVIQLQGYIVKDVTDLMIRNLKRRDPRLKHKSIFPRRQIENIPTLDYGKIIVKENYSQQGSRMIVNYD